MHVEMHSLSHFRQVSGDFSDGDYGQKYHRRAKNRALAILQITISQRSRA